MKAFYLIVALLFLAGCESAPLAVNYTPSSLIQGKGSIQATGFTYAPADQKKVNDDQIKNTALGTIHLGQPVKEYVEKAFNSELKYAGYSLDKSHTKVTGSIEEFVADDLGYSVDWTLKMKVSLKDASNKTIAKKEILVKKKLEKFSEFSVALNWVLKDAFEQMMSDKSFKSSIH
jgi:uncharacterized lipoprotein YajG